MIKSETLYSDSTKDQVFFLPCKLRIIEIPWVGSAEMGSVLSYDDKSKTIVRKLLPDNLMEYLSTDQKPQCNPLLIDVDGMNQIVAGDKLIITDLIPYIISTKDSVFVFLHQAYFELRIGNTFKIPVGPTQCEHGSGVSRVELGEPIIIPEFQTLHVAVGFHGTGKASFKNLLESIMEETNLVRVSIGLKIVGRIQSEQRVQADSY